MTYIKKMVVQGFKSFAKKTEIPFDRGINVVIGPNGSGKSNISDALCFALGRLSVKSMRAAKTSNLIFMGTKQFKPAKEASVEIFFDNTERTFQMNSDEVVMKRIVRRNGQGIYKVNGETKTRNEVLELLAHAGIDPYGFNIVLQGQIQSIVKMHPEERRKIIEEAAGISVYESRKEKSLHELEKTEEKLKEINSILRERTSYLKNLEKEKQQAEKFKDLELNVKRCKASLLTKRKEAKEKELKSVEESIEKDNKQKEQIRAKIEKIRLKIEKLNEKINSINKHIQLSAGVEQESLHSNIASLKADCEGLRVRKESHENRKREIERRIAEMSSSTPSIESEIQELKSQSPIVAKKSNEIKKKKEELSKIEEELRKIQANKAELFSLKDRIKDKENQITRSNVMSESIVKHLEELSKNLVHSDEKSGNSALALSKQKLNDLRKEIETLRQKELEHERAISVAESNIQRHLKVKSDVEKLDVCPLCQCKITEEHKSHVFSDCDNGISQNEGLRESAKQELNKIADERTATYKLIQQEEARVFSTEHEIRKHLAIADKKSQLKRTIDEQNTLKKEITELNARRAKLEEGISNVNDIEERYHSALLSIEEVSSRTAEDVDTTLLYKERELEKIKSIVVTSTNDIKELSVNIVELTEKFESKTKTLLEKETQEKELNERFKTMFADREDTQKIVQEKNYTLIEYQRELREVEEQANHLMIGKAKLDAEKESVEMELQEFSGVELISGSQNVIEERLLRDQEALRNIGSINMRALEVYQDVKKEYDAVQVKVDTLAKEKEEIMKIIEEIDKKKYREFMRTFREINELFSQNFSKISTKGEAYLEIENPDDLFSGGVLIVVKLAKGKYFDVTSLSGGEQTMVALSLLFAIQEFKPYHFYVFDEIDAALDKHNSERLADLLNQYMKSGQYIVVTHNDALIMNAHVLYGVSMHEGMSKILSLRLDKVEKAKQTDPVEGLDDEQEGGGQALGESAGEVKDGTESQA